MKFLVLYTELAGYFYSCIETLISENDAEVLIINWPINKQAPFVFKQTEKIRIIERNEFSDFESLLSKCKAFNPDIVYVSGWMDREYLKVAKYFRKKNMPVILALDNQWVGTIKQWIATILSRFFILPSFSHIWVPGLFQYEYARRLSFNRSKIAIGMYSGNQPVFYEAYLSALAQKKASYPRNFIYVGRLSPEKGTLELFNLFNQFSGKERNGWTLTFVGTGPLRDQIFETDTIKIKGFMQPELLPSLVADAGALIFPSKQDAWGVSIHEFCAAGLPLLVTNAAGAITAFVKEGYNGNTFEANDIESLKHCLLNFMSKQDEDYLQMGDRSAQISFQITPQIWASTLMSFR